MGAQHTPLGSGLFVGDGTGYSTPQKPFANPLPCGRWRAEIEGVENGVVVRSWVGETYARKAEALDAAIAKASGQ